MTTAFSQTGGSSARVFVITEYHADEKGVLKAKIPPRCPLCEPGEGLCHLSLDGIRKRPGEKSSGRNGETKFCSLVGQEVV